ncbi:MAG: hypothetical protein IPF52_16445 [Saprospiraceae bacterium]|nr:hypothetical protein [Saprospiraceae bacterium]
MSKYILLLLLLVPKMLARTTTGIKKSYPYKVAIQINIFNLIIIPSLPVEQNNKIVGNFHQSNIVFFTENNCLNATLD